MFRANKRSQSMSELPLWVTYSRLDQWFPSYYVQGPELAFSPVLEIHSEVELHVVMAF